MFESIVGAAWGRAGSAVWRVPVLHAGRLVSPMTVETSWHLLKPPEFGHVTALR